MVDFYSTADNTGWRYNNLAIEYLFFHPNARDSFKKLPEQQKQLLFGASLLFAILFGGLRGIFTHAFSNAQSGFFGLGQFSTKIEINVITFFSSALLVLTFFVILSGFYHTIYSGFKDKHQNFLVDVTFVIQLSIVKDLFYLGFIYFHVDNSPSYSSSFGSPTWIWVTDAVGVDITLNLVFFILMSLFFVPQIMTRLESPHTHIDRSLFIALLISFVISIFVFTLNFIIQLLINLALF